jgi:cob(I)alamin adenosyltransferase
MWSLESGLGSRHLSGGVTTAGLIAIIASVAGMVLGLVLVGSIAADLAATMSLSRSAMGAIGDTIEVLDDAAGRIDESLDAAAGSVSGASDTAAAAATGLEEMALFLDEGLPDQIEAIRQSMPAAIQAAGAVDATLSALSFFGVDYNPDEPFDESLRRVEAALTGLPDDLRTQSESLQGLVPAARELSLETDRLALALDALQQDLGSLQELTDSYQATVEQAEATIEATESSLAGQAWLLRALVVAAAVAGLAVGGALILIGSALAQVVEEPETDPAFPTSSS